MSWKLCKYCGENDLNKFYDADVNICKKDRNKLRNEKYRERFEHFNEDERIKHIFNVRIMGCKNRAEKKGFEYNLTTQFILDRWNQQDGKCFLSGVDMNFDSDSWEMFTIDRLEPDLGYVESNVVLTTKFMNLSRNKMTLSEYKQKMKLYFDKKIVYNEWNN